MIFPLSLRNSRCVIRLAIVGNSVAQVLPALPELGRDQAPAHCVVGLVVGLREWADLIHRWKLTLGARPARSVRTGQHDDDDSLRMADVKKVRIRRRQRLRTGPRSLRSDAIRHAHGPATAVVMACAQPTSCQAESGVNVDGVKEPELGKVESHPLLLELHHSDEVIEHLGDTDRCEASIVALKHRRDSRRCRFVAEVCDGGEAVEDSQRREARAVSCARADLRAASAVGPRPRYRPRSSSAGRRKAGRNTTRSPRSTTISRRVFQRDLTSAGTDTWPFLDSVMTRDVLIEGIV
jgi:hypothetical protein